MQSRIVVNMVSESDISVQGHGVHTAYIETATALENRSDVTVIRNEFGKSVNCDVIHLHTVGSRAWRKLRQKGPKKVVSAHVVPNSFVGSLVGASLWRPLAAWYLRWFYNQADALVAVSIPTADELRRIGVTKPIHVIYNSIDTASYQLSDREVRQQALLRRELDIADGSFVVIGAGQVQPRKRVDLFVQIAKKMPETTFIWVGGINFGYYAAKHADMERLMQEAPKNVLFPGIVDLKKMKLYYALADMFWLPSEQETFGLVIVEAAASGLPVLVRDLHDYDDTFGDNVLRGVDTTFMDKISSLRDNHADRQKWAKKSARIARKFDNEMTVERYISLYRSLLGERQ